MSVCLLLATLVVSGSQPALKFDTESDIYKNAIKVAKMKNPEFHESCGKLLDAKKFDELDLALYLARTKFPNNKPHDLKVRYFYTYVRNRIAKGKGVEELVDLWLKHNPNSSPALLCKARVYSDQGWLIRGRGSARSLTDDQIKGFRSKLTRAQEYIEKVVDMSKKYSVDHDVVTEQKLSLLTGLGGSKEEVLKILKEGVKHSPEQVHIYTAAANLLLPRWFGENSDDWKIAANMAVENTKKKFGQMNYARIVCGITLIYKTPSLMMARKADYSRLKQGFRDWLKHNPGSPAGWNYYRIFAIKQLDQEGLREVFDLKTNDTKILPKLWSFTHDRYMERDLADWKEWAQETNLLPKNQRLLFASGRANFDATCFSHDGKYLFLGLRQGGVIKVDFKTEKAVGLLEGDERVIDLYSWPNAPLVAIVAEKNKGRASGFATVDPYVRVVNYENDKELVKLPLRAKSAGLDISSKGEYLVVPSPPGKGDVTIARYDTEKKSFKVDHLTLRGLSDEQRGEISCRCLAITQSKEYPPSIVIPHKQGLCHYSLSKNKVLDWKTASAGRPEFRGKYLVWLRSNGTNVLGAGQREVGVWDFNKRNLDPPPKMIHGNNVRKPIYNQKRDVFATCNWINSTIRIWDAPTGKCINVLRTPEVALYNAVAFSPDGNTLVFCASNGNNSSVTAFDLEHLDKVQKKK